MRSRWPALPYTSALLVAATLASLMPYLAPEVAWGQTEVYSATDPDASPADPEALLGKEIDSPNSDDGTAWVGIVDEPLPAENSESKVNRPSAPRGWGLYDPVPSRHLKEILERLRLSALLVQRHGRAYDYRIHTAVQLKKQLALLEQEKKNSRPTSPVRR